MRIFITLIFALSLNLLAQPTNELRYFIIVTGGELLEGVYPDAHTPFITRTLHPLGGKCVGSMSVDDNRAEMLNALSYASKTAPVILVTGGLGPTPNDITREVLSEFTAIPLAENKDLVSVMEIRLGEKRSGIRPNLLKQTRVPATGHFRNSSGTAAGLLFKSSANTIIALPGPPRELQPMFQDDVVPYLQKNFDLHEHITRLAVRFYGVGQSQIDQTIKEKISLPEEVIVTSLFEGMRVDFFFTLPGKSSENQDKLNKIGSALRQHLGPRIYAMDGQTTLEDVFLGKVAKEGKLLIIDQATGGSVGAALYARPNAGELLVGNISGLASDTSRIARAHKASQVLIIDRKGGNIRASFGRLNHLKTTEFPYQSNTQVASEIFNRFR